MPETITSLIVGADGMIGHAWLQRLLAQRQAVTGTTRRDPKGDKSRCYLDLLDNPAVWSLPDRIRYAYLFAAVTALKDCQRDPRGTSLVNVERTVELARRLIDAGASVMFLSTNLVFDGRTPFPSSDRPSSPVTQYGQQKAEAEKQLLALGGNVTILRMTKVLGPSPQLFQGWRTALEQGDVVRPFNDRWLSPISLNLVLEAISRLTGQSGLFHLSAATEVTYAEVCQYIADRLGSPEHLVQPIRASASETVSEPVGPHVSLDMTATTRLTGVVPPDPWTVIDQVMQW